MYRAVLRESIKRLDDFCDSRGGLFMMILDEQGDHGFREASSLRPRRRFRRGGGEFV